MIKFPKYAKIDGVDYPINTDYKTALKCLDLMNSDINGYKRMVGVLTLLFGKIPLNERTINEGILKAKKYLEFGNEQGDNSKPLMDITQDSQAIYSSFVEQYPTKDLDNMHFWEFIILLKGINPDTALGRIMELRNLDLSDYTDKKQKEKIRKAQQRVALKHETSEQDTNEQRAYLEEIGIPTDFIDRHLK